MDVEELIWPIIRMMNGDGSMNEKNYGDIIDRLRWQRDEITQLRAELAAERELADRFRMVLLIHKGSNGWGLAEQEVLECYRTRRNK